MCLSAIDIENFNKNSKGTFVVCLIGIEDRVEGK